MKDLFSFKLLGWTIEGRRGAARSPALYAIEFGEYAAKAGEAFIARLNVIYGRSGTPFEEQDDEEIREHARTLQSCIYEFRKRAKKTDAWLGEAKP